MPSGRKAIPYYKRDRLKSVAYSALLHLVILLLAIFGLPFFLTSPPPDEPMAISVEVLPVGAISNVKPSRHEPQEKKVEEHKVKPKEAPPVKVAEEEAPPPKQEPSILPKPKPKPKPEQKKEKPKPKHHQDDLAAVLRAVKQTADNEKKKENQEDADSDSKTRSQHYNPSLPMSLSEIDSIRNQIARCWNVPAGAKDAQNLVVVLRLQLAPDGTVLKVELAGASQSRYDSDSFFRAAADSARRAVEECSPIKNLPQDKYATWRDMEMKFDPKEMLF